jgi:hypothetical protein
MKKTAFAHILRVILDRLRSASIPRVMALFFLAIVVVSAAPFPGPSILSAK